MTGSPSSSSTRRSCGGSLPKCRQQSPALPLRRTPARRSSLGSPSCSPTRGGSRTSIRPRRRRAVWAAGSANGSYRGDDGSLSLFSLVVPPRAETPIHDHLAWGLVGLYRGTQDEEIYARGNGGLELVERRSLVPGDFYVLIPPRDDIHRVRTTSAETSVSIHLLTNDTGCVWRHAYDPESGEARPFRSGYVNVSCG